MRIDALEAEKSIFSDRTLLQCQARLSWRTVSRLAAIANVSKDFFFVFLHLLTDLHAYFFEIDMFRLYPNVYAFCIQII